MTATELIRGIEGVSQANRSLLSEKTSAVDEYMQPLGTKLRLCCSEGMKFCYFLALSQNLTAFRVDNHLTVNNLEVDTKIPPSHLWDGIKLYILMI